MKSYSILYGPFLTEISYIDGMVIFQNNRLAIREQSHIIQNLYNVLANQCGGLYLMFIGPPLRSLWICYCPQLYVACIRLLMDQHETTTDYFVLFLLYLYICNKT